MGRTLFAFGIFALLSASNANAGISTCAQTTEKAALDARVLQTQLMVAALSCQEKQRYNNFVKGFQPQLAQRSKEMRQYFTRVYGKNGNAKLDEFVTRIANEMSKWIINITLPKFCDRADTLFKEALTPKAAPSISYLLVTNAPFAYDHGISDCKSISKHPKSDAVEKPVKAAKKKKKVKKTKAS